MHPTVVLFDIDGTIISADGAGRRALERAFHNLLGNTRCLEFSFAGMTDYAIVRKGLTIANHAARDVTISAVLDHYLSFLPEEIAAASEYQVHRGIEMLIDTLDEETHVALGLGTGNVEKGAMIKLDRSGLSSRFSFGGFGSDHEIRSKLLAIGATRGAAQLEVELESCRVVVVGDTPNDIRAAQEIGAESIAVATGPYSVERLLAHRPTVALDHLEHPRVLDIIRGTGLE